MERPPPASCGEQVKYASGDPITALHLSAQTKRGSSSPPASRPSAEFLQVQPWTLETIHGLSFRCYCSASVFAAPSLSDPTPSLQTSRSPEIRPWSPQAGTSSWDSSNQVIPRTTTSECCTIRSVSRLSLGWQIERRPSSIRPPPC